MRAPDASTTRRCTVPPPRRSRAAGIAASDLKVEAPPAARARRSRRRLLRDRQGARAKPGAGRAGDRRRVPADRAARSATAAGPFVNFRARPRRRVPLAGRRRARRDRSLPRTLGAGQTICIDYGSPNISKHLAYHHIRSTTIGHSLAQTFRALGYRVVGINFLGDWGTTHGMLIAAWKQVGRRPSRSTSTRSTSSTCGSAAAKDDPALEARRPRVVQAARGRRCRGARAVAAVPRRVVGRVRGGLRHPRHPVTTTSTARASTSATCRGVLDGARTRRAARRERGRAGRRARRREDAAPAARPGRHDALRDARHRRGASTAGTRTTSRARSTSSIAARRCTSASCSSCSRRWASTGSARCEHVPYGLVRVGGKKTAHAARQRRADARGVRDRRGRGPREDRRGQPATARRRRGRRGRARGRHRRGRVREPRAAAREGHRLRSREGGVDSTATRGRTSSTATRAARRSCARRGERDRVEPTASTSRGSTTTPSGRSRAGCSTSPTIVVARRGRLRAARHLPLPARARRRVLALVHARQRRRVAARARRRPG